MAPTSEVLIKGNSPLSKNFLSWGAEFPDLISAISPKVLNSKILLLSIFSEICARIFPSIIFSLFIFFSIFSSKKSSSFSLDLKSGKSFSSIGFLFVVSEKPSLLIFPKKT